MFQKTDFWIGLAVGAVAAIASCRSVSSRWLPCSRLLPQASCPWQSSSARRKSWRTLSLLRKLSRNNFLFVFGDCHRLRPGSLFFYVRGRKFS